LYPPSRRQLFWAHSTRLKTVVNAVERRPNPGDARQWQLHGDRAASERSNNVVRISTAAVLLPFDIVAMRRLILALEEPMRR
jgi:hypothetical protein